MAPAGTCNGGSFPSEPQVWEPSDIRADPVAIGMIQAQHAWQSDAQLAQIHQDEDPQKSMRILNVS